MDNTELNSLINQLSNALSQCGNTCEEVTTSLQALSKSLYNLAASGTGIPIENPKQKIDLEIFGGIGNQCLTQYFYDEKDSLYDVLERMAEDWDLITTNEAQEVIIPLSTNEEENMFISPLN